MVAWSRGSLSEGLTTLKVTHCQLELALKDKKTRVTKILTIEEVEGATTITTRIIIMVSNTAGEVRIKSLRGRIIATMVAKEQQILGLIHTTR